MAPKVIFTFFLSLALPTAQAQTQYSPDEYLKNFALSTCLAKGFPDGDIARDAKAAAGGYVELGSYDAEAYMESLEIVDQFLSRSYESKNSDTPLTTMKCIDLYHSTELQALADKYRSTLEQHPPTIEKN